MKIIKKCIKIPLIPKLPLFCSVLSGAFTLRPDLVVIIDWFSELGCCKNSSKGEESMKLGMMVGIDHTNKFRVVAKMNYA